MGFYYPPENVTIESLAPISASLLDGVIHTNSIPGKDVVSPNVAIDASFRIEYDHNSRDIVWNLYTTSALTINAPDFLAVATPSLFTKPGQFLIIANTGNFVITIATTSTVPLSTIHHSESVVVNPHRSVMFFYSSGYWTVLGSPASVGALGTIASQNANSVAITGGTINGTVIGATTPSTGRFSLLNVNTAVVGGTIAQFGSPGASLSIADSIPGLIGLHTTVPTLHLGYNLSTGQSQRVIVGQRIDNGGSSLQAPSASFRTMYATGLDSAINPSTGSIISSGGLGVRGDAQIGGSTVTNKLVLRGDPYTFETKVSGLSTTHLRSISPTAPATPALYDEWLEYTAPGKPVEDWFWNGTRWCSKKLYSSTLFSSSVSATVTNWFPNSGVVRSTASGIIAERVEHFFYLNGAAINTTNHWDAQILWASTNSVYNALYPLTPFPATANNTKTSVVHTPTVAFIPIADFVNWRYNYVKVNVPGILVIESTVYFRLTHL
ncbi:hypothetical protein [Chroococcidiopsis sp.]|uniref:hypothetical protein n=1 Tax=Chroococcidiopsis sp. TaxID=3088168 RepID=UPI003F36AED2